MPSFLRNRWVLFGILGALVVIVGGLYLQGQAKASKAKAAAVSAKAIPSPFSAIAAGKADVEGGIIQVAARTSGIVQSVEVQEGDKVAKGQILAQLQDDQPRLAVASSAASVAQAQAQIGLLMVQKATAEREYARLQKLQARNFIAGPGRGHRRRRDQDRRRPDRRAALRRGHRRGRAERGALSARTHPRARAHRRADRAPLRQPRHRAPPPSTSPTCSTSNPPPPTSCAPKSPRATSPTSPSARQAEMAADASPGKLYTGKVLRRSDEFGGRKLLSDDPTEQTDARVVEVVISADGAPFLIGQRILVKFMKPGQQAGAAHAPVAATPKGS